MAARRKRPFNAESFLAEAGDGRTIDQYRKNQIVFSQGSHADAIFYILKGQVVVKIVSPQGKEAIVAILGPNNFFGHRSLAGTPRRTGTVTTMMECSIMRIQKDVFARTLHEEPVFAELFMAYLLDRCFRTEADLIDQLFNTSERRLARLLVSMANFDKDGGLDLTTLKISQEILAEKIGTTRARVSYFMNKFKKLGCIDYKGDIRVHRSLSNLISSENLKLRA